MDKPPPSFLNRKQQVKELDSCNSSDALLMNIFCHPRIDDWKSPKKLLGIFNIGEAKFGFLAKVKKSNGQDDATEIDMKLDGNQRLYSAASLVGINKWALSLLNRKKLLFFRPEELFFT